MVSQQLYEIEQIGSIEGSVREMYEWLQICIIMVEDEVVRLVVHPAHEFSAVVDDGSTVAPGENSSEQPGYFYILFFGKGVGDANGVFFYKRGLVV